jgi:hypothetical protein
LAISLSTYYTHPPRAVSVRHTQATHEWKVVGVVVGVLVSVLGLEGHATKHAVRTGYRRLQLRVLASGVVVRSYGHVQVRRHSPVLQAEAHVVHMDAHHRQPQARAVHQRLVLRCAQSVSRQMTPAQRETRGSDPNCTSACLPSRQRGGARGK